MTLAPYLATCAYQCMIKSPYSNQLKKLMAKQSTKGKVKVDKDASVLEQRLFEGLFVLIFALSIFIFLSLFTYHAADMSATKASLIANRAGLVGAWLSKQLLWIFGYLSYVLPIGLCYWAFSLVKYPLNLKDKFDILLLRLLGFILMMLGLCGIASLEGISFGQTMPFSSGGALGFYVAKALYVAFELAGSMVLLLAISLIGLTLLSNVSWLSFVERIGFWTTQSVVSFKTMLITAKARVQERLAQREKTAPVREKVHVEVKKVRAKKDKKPAKEKVAKEEKEDNVLKVNEKPRMLNVSKRYHQDRQKKIFKDNEKGVLPPLSLLSLPKESREPSFSHMELEERSREVEQKLLDFGIEVQVVAVHPGPVITRFEMQLSPGLKVSKISSLGKDLARSLSVTSVRIVEVIAGKSVVGLELPNEKRDVVCLSEVLATPNYDEVKSPTSLALGVDIAGHPVIVDLAKMPHLLVAGTTGSGKSVGINAMILSLLFKATADEVRLILIDPKMLELSIYEGIPHLLTPVVTDMKDAANALRWCVGEMERRYRLMAALGVRNLAGFNKKVREAIKKDKPIVDPLIEDPTMITPKTLEPLPCIVVVIDELADMMMVVGKKVEQLIARIAQKARAAGIHLILATQRPSVDVLTGLIKSNIPTRISFQVSSKIDSRTILDQQGAEQLLGHGDMLYLAPGAGSPQRVHGAFVEDNEVHRVADSLRMQGEPDYLEEITQGGAASSEFLLDEDKDTEDSDPLYDEAVEFVVQTRKASVSSVQRRFKIGYNRAARLVEEMERTGVVGPLEGTVREVLAPAPPSED